MHEGNQGLYEKLIRLQRLLRKQRHRRNEEGGPTADPTWGQGRILALLKIQEGLSTKELSYLLGVRVSSLNETLSKLEKRGYIHREPDSDDKRIMLVRLTEKGREEPQQKERFHFLDCLSEEERENLGQYLDRMIASLEETLDDEPTDTQETLQILMALRQKYGDRFDEMILRVQEGHVASHGCHIPPHSFGGKHRHRHHRFSEEGEGR